MIEMLCGDYSCFHKQNLKLPRKSYFFLISLINVMTVINSMMNFKYRWEFVLKWLYFYVYFVCCLFSLIPTRNWLEINFTHTGAPPAYTSSKLSVRWVGEGHSVRIYLSQGECVCASRDNSATYSEENEEKTTLQQKPNKVSSHLKHCTSAFSTVINIL